MTSTIERLTDPQPESFTAMVAESEREDWRFLRRLANEWSSGVNRFDRPGEALFAARVGREIAGVCGLNIDPYASTNSVGRVRHLYVLPACRRLGIGRKLVTVVIDAAQNRFDCLRLRTESPEAARFYERLGFGRCAGVPDCTHVMEMRVTVSGDGLPGLPIR